MLVVIAEVWTKPSRLVLYSPEGVLSGTVVFLLGFFGIGFVQVICVLPLLFWLESRLNYREAAKGVVIAASITLLINGGCFWVVW